MRAGNILTLKDACKVEMLRKHIYEGVVQQYGLQRVVCEKRNGNEPIEIEIDAFYVGLALNYVDTKWNEKYIFSWDEDSLENVLRMLVTEFKTNFLEKLLDLYKPHSFITQKLEKIADTICPEQQYHEKYPDFLPNDKLGCFIRLFIHALEKRQFKASLFYWTKQERLIWTSLFARHVLKEEKRKQKIDMLENVKAKFQKYKRIYECTAINILKSCYRRNRNRTLFLLMNVDSKCKQSCITIALKTKNKLFLAQEACIRANNEIWQTYLGEDLSTEQRKEDNQTESKAKTKKLDKPLQEEKKSENKMLPREVRPDRQTKRDSRSEQKKELDKLLHKEENSEIELADFHADSNTNVNNKLPDTTPTTVTKKKINIKHYLFSPQGRCRMDMISYLWFLTAYSILLVSTLHQTTFHWLEGVVMGYKVIFFAKESDQCFPQCFKSWKTFRHYICDPFNILDHLSILISIMAWSLRWVAFVNPEEERLMVAARYLLCLVFMLYMVRFLEFFYQDEFFGPILVVIRNMVKTYIYFLLILANIVVTYSVVSESILFPEKELKADILYSVFRRGFWAMLGEYFLDEIELFSDDTSNNSDTANSSMRGTRPTEDGKYSIPILLAVYVLFVQILMFNLLIALFNNAISENETKGRMIWSHQKFLLTMQYSKTKILLPPFIILSFCLKEKFGNPFKTKKGDKVNILKKFEREAAKMIINQIIKQRYVNKFSHDDTKVASVAQVKNMEKKLMKLSGSLRERRRAKKNDRTS
ncbi:transient receptor potential cation channel subfamily M member-like 2 isoform X2 [Biomphalaria glabrata]|uniref:Transient receptor potential cation channel subfamily M member-like 2 isoform X2 n=1 Tax=Biomphalaria glabrata TaxID=6526 RepID=A0A9W3A2C0_BIOGL|nr:transient receptor potential cation channel subfamily M member-like 2 isoform X2 [Biomphalaria glabrata]